MSKKSDRDKSKMQDLEKTIKEHNKAQAKLFFGLQKLYVELVKERGYL